MWSRKAPHITGWYWFLDNQQNLKPREIFLFKGASLQSLDDKYQDGWWGPRIYEPHYDLNELLQNKEIEDTGARKVDHGTD